MTDNNTIDLETVRLSRGSHKSPELRPTKEHLQSSAMELVHRLIAMTDGEGA